MRYALIIGSFVPSSRTSVTVARRLVALACLVVGATVLSPATGGAQEDAPGGRGHADPDDAALVDVDIDVMKSDDTDVQEALTDISANVEAQVEQLANARSALATADQQVAAADLAVAETEGRIDTLSVQTDGIVINAFMNPPAEVALDAFSAGSLTDLSVKQSILNTKATSDADTLELYEQARDQLDVQLAERAGLVETAEQNREAAETALIDLESALSQSALFAVRVEERLDQTLAEADSLAEVDPVLAAQLQAREAQLAAALGSMQAEAQRVAAVENSAALAVEAEGNKGYGTIKQPPGGVVSVPCPTGGSVEVAGDISSQVTRLLNDSAAAGAAMCGGGYRDPQDQIAVRRANCGTSTYAIYEAPSSYCSPPTARPGTSMHEQGLAIDFKCGGSTSVRYGDRCHDWLRSHAEEYGLYNLPSEPWHWSVSGE